MLTFCFCSVALCCFQRNNHKNKSTHQAPLLVSTMSNNIKNSTKPSPQVDEALSLSTTLPPQPPSSSEGDGVAAAPSAPPPLISRWFKNGKPTVPPTHAMSTGRERAQMGRSLLLASNEWKRLLSPILPFAFVQEELVLLYRR